MNEATQKALNDYLNARDQLLLITGLSIFLSTLLAAFIIRTFSRGIAAVIASLNENAVQVAAASEQLASSSEELYWARVDPFIFLPKVGGQFLNIKFYPNINHLSLIGIWIID